MEAIRAFLLFSVIIWIVIAEGARFTASDPYLVAEFNRLKAARGRAKEVRTKEDHLRECRKSYVWALAMCILGVII
jgi:hypothetical protein